MAALVSVVVPMYNAAGVIKETIESVLRQSYPDIEVVIVDDGSSDSSASVVRQLSQLRDRPIRLIQQPNGGVSRARNAGLEVVQGDLIAFLDADDVWEADKIAMQVSELDADPRLAGVVCAYRMFDSSTGADLGVVRPLVTDAFIADWVSLNGPGPLLPSTLLARRVAVEELGGFDEQLSTAADADFGVRLQRFGAIGSLPDVLVRYRMSEGQMHRNPEVLARDYVILLDKPYIRADPRLRRRTQANVGLHVAYKRLREQPSLGHLGAFAGVVARHPLAAGRRWVRRLMPAARQS